MPVTADIPKLICPVCGDEQPDMTDGLDDMQNLYDAYFAATGVRIGGKR